MRQHPSLPHTDRPHEPTRSRRRARLVAALAAGATAATVAALSAAVVTDAAPAAAGNDRLDAAAAAPAQRHQQVPPSAAAPGGFPAPAHQARRGPRRPLGQGAAEPGAGLPGWPESATSSQAALVLRAETSRYRLSAAHLIAAERAQLDVVTRRAHASSVRPAARIPTSWTDSALHLSLSTLDAPLRAGSLQRHLSRRLSRRSLSSANTAYADDGVSSSTWLELRLCESGDDYAADTGNGYYGAYQFLAATWWSLGYTGMPDTAPPTVQDAAARKLLAVQGWGAWPECSARLGL